MATKKKEVSIEKQLGLTPEELRIASWRDLPPLQWKEPKVDKKVWEFVDDYYKFKVLDSVWSSDSNRDKLTNHKYWNKLLSKDEASFWFLYETENDYSKQEKVAKDFHSKTLHYEEIKNLLLQNEYKWISSKVMVSLLTLLPLEQIMQLIFELDDLNFNVGDALEKIHLLTIYHDTKTLQKYHKQVQERLAKCDTEKLPSLQPWLMLAGALRDSTTVKEYFDKFGCELLRDYPDKHHFTGNQLRPERTLLLLAGLPTQKDVVNILTEYPRMNYSLTYDSRDQRDSGRKGSWILFSNGLGGEWEYCFETAGKYAIALLGLDNMKILSQLNWKVASKLFSKMLHPKVAPYLLKDIKTKKWLDKNLSLAIIGITQDAIAHYPTWTPSDPDENPDEVIAQQLTWLSEKLEEHGTAPFEEVADQLTEEEKTFLTERNFLVSEGSESILPKKKRVTWITEALSLYAQKPKVGVITASELPEITIDGESLEKDEIELILIAFQNKVTYSNKCYNSMQNQRNAFLQRFKKEVAAIERENFALALLEKYTSSWQVRSEKWVLLSGVVELGGDLCVDLLASQVAKQSYNSAVDSLNALQTIGTERALIAIHGISQKMRSGGVKRHAERVLSAIAFSRKLSKTELEDLLIPKCGLDGKGKKLFSFGTRSFSFVLSDDMKPKIIDENGKVKADLPKPNSKDDAEKASAAVAEWKQLKKDIRDAVKNQVSRLEVAMVHNRLWRVEKFTTNMATHPFMTLLAQRLLWGVFEGNGNLKTTFRVTDEQTFVTVDDEEITLPKGTDIGLVHPLQLSEEERGRWSEVFDDYELVSPFPQLNRMVFAAGDVDLSRYEGMTFGAQTLIYGLSNNEWYRGIVEDAGLYYEHLKYFPHADVTASVSYDGCVGVGYIDKGEKLTVKKVLFAKGEHSCINPNEGPRHRFADCLDPKNVDLIAFSEIMKDLEPMAQKAIVS